MNRYFLDWLGNMINYSILLLIFLRSFNSGYFSLFDMLLSAFGLVASMIIFVVHLINEDCLSR